MLTDEQVNPTEFGVFSRGQLSFSYIAPDDTPPQSTNRNDVKDLFFDTVLQERFSKHLHIIRKQAPQPPKPVQPEVDLTRHSALPEKKETGTKLVEPYKPDQLRMNCSQLGPNGKPVVGSILNVSGWYLDHNRAACSFQWKSAGTDIAGATTDTYVAQPADQGKEVSCEATYRGLDVPGGVATTFVSALITVIEATPIELIRLEVQGGPTHLDPLRVIATYNDGQYHLGECQWTRAEGRAQEFTPLKGQTAEVYWPTADDLPCQLQLQYTVLEGEQRGRPAYCAVQDSFLTIHPDVAAAVESYIKAGQAEFVVEDLQGKPRTILANTKKVKLIDPADPKHHLSTPHNAAVMVKLYSKQENLFALQLGPKVGEPIPLKCKDRKERDIIALTIRSFIGSTVQTYEANKSKKLHSVHSLSEIGHYTEK